MGRARYLTLTIALFLSMALADAAGAQAAKQLFGAQRTPAAAQPAPFGGYAKGCIAGAVELPETGSTWQAMRLSRNRNWGHPDTIAFLKDLSAQAARQPGWSGLYIGDISQPRGGPMLTGHASHQIGLDADIWMLPPQRLNLSRNERENISSISLRRAEGAYVPPASRGHQGRGIRSTRGADLCLSGRQGADVQGRTRRSCLSAQDPAMVWASLPFPCAPELPARCARLSGSGHAATR